MSTTSYLRSKSYRASGLVPWPISADCTRPQKWGLSDEAADAPLQTFKVSTDAKSFMHRAWLLYEQGVPSAESSQYI